MTKQEKLVEYFDKLISDEREECAKICETAIRDLWPQHMTDGELLLVRTVLESVVRKIRNRM